MNSSCNAWTFIPCDFSCDNKYRRRFICFSILSTYTEVERVDVISNPSSVALTRGVIWGGVDLVKVTLWQGIVCWIKRWTLTKNMWYALSISAAPVTQDQSHSCKARANLSFNFTMSARWSVFKQDLTTVQITISSRLVRKRSKVWRPRVAVCTICVKPCVAALSVNVKLVKITGKIKYSLHVFTTELLNVVKEPVYEITRIINRFRWMV